MSRFSGWFKGSTPKPSNNSSPTVSQVDLRARSITLLYDAIAGTGLIMNDDIDGAEARLSKGNSTFHLFGLAVCSFVKSLLGLEDEVMAEAVSRLSACEKSALNDIKSEKEASTANPQTERIYPSGSEYQLLVAESHLMSALVGGLLHESVTEAIKSFYKIRKAYVALDAILEAEGQYLAKRGQPTPPMADVTLPSETMPGSFNGQTDIEFFDADESHSGQKTPSPHESHLANGNTDEVKKQSMDFVDTSGTLPPLNLASQLVLQDGPESDIFSDPIDAFIHSGASMCFGALLLIISLVPPTFSRLLYIIGFKGDRERGIKMLWQSSRFDNINGAVSALVLLAYYNGLLSPADILPSEADVEKGAIMGYPKEKLTVLQVKLRGRYPDSGLWRFEEARTREVSKDLAGALTLLKTNKSKMKQVVALNQFTLALVSTYVQNWSDARDYYVQSVELSDWSPSLYYYLAGCAELELYRNAFFADPKDDAQIRSYRTNAEALFNNAYTAAGKRRFMARPFPFEQFVVRKIKKWRERSTALGIELVDAIGISPVEEMVYLWNGLKKMQPAELENAMGILSWDRFTCPEENRSEIQGQTDERAMRDLCYAAILRNLGKFDEARAKLNDILKLDKSDFRGPTSDDYILPAAHYEMAVLIWAEKQTGTPAETKKRIDDCQSWLNKVSKWGPYVLEARMDMRVQTAMDTLRWYSR
ncbi:breast cancer protein [Xylaria nigripes]|nr:breast cancer protein [Xylaria nigripes]